jgi:hypothetical protein
MADIGTIDCSHNDSIISLGASTLDILGEIEGNDNTFAFDLVDIELFDYE